MAQLVTLSQARQLVPPPAGVKRKTFADGLTSDIIDEVLSVGRANLAQVSQLAPLLVGSSERQTCANVHGFVRGRVKYVLDPPGKQYVKTPSAIIHEGFSDCKGYATLTNALLNAVGIQSAFRFAGYVPGSQQVTHVYSVAYPAGGGGPVIIDACLPQFNQEKPYQYHEDHMTQIIRVSGLADQIYNETPLRLSGNETGYELDLLLHRQGAELDRNIVAGIHGIGSPQLAAAQEAVDDYHGAVAALQVGGVGAFGSFIKKLQARAKKRGFFLHGPGVGIIAPREVRRIGFLKKLFNKAKNAVKKVTSFAKKTVVNTAKAALKTAGKVAKTVARGAVAAGKGIAKGAVAAGKFALKVVTAPMRLLAKGILELTLPQIAPMFIYLFITNQQTIASLPADVQRKRRKAEKFAKFITGTIGLSEARFMKVVRNGIMKKMGGTPEQILGQRVKGPISGIGIAFVALIPIAIKLVEKLMSVFGAKPSEEEKPTEADAPDLNADLGEATPTAARKLATNMQRKPVSQRGQEPDSTTRELAQEATERATARAVEREPEGTPVDAPLPEPTAADYASADEPEGEAPSAADSTVDYGSDETASGEYAPTDEEVSGPRRRPRPAGQSRPQVLRRGRLPRLRA